MGRDSSVGRETRYGLDCPGIESQEARFSAPVQTGPGAHPASSTMGTGCFPGKAAGDGASHPVPFYAEANESVELYPYSSLGVNGLYTVPFTADLRKQARLRRVFPLYRLQGYNKVWEDAL
jgi:hypothetical protein